MALLEQEPDRDLSEEVDAAARRRALRRLAAKRHFRLEVVVAAVAVGLLVLVWGLSEYHNAGGWPTHGFSQSSGIHDVWNYWIVYPVVGIALLLGARAWFVYGSRPPSEDEIRREIERERAELAGRSRHDPDVGGTGES